jgi:hypothetical protein
MFIGYADDHDGDAYRMWNPKTERVHITRDVIWMRQMMFTKGVEEAVIEIDNDNAEEGQSDDKERANRVTVEDNGSNDESEDDLSDEEPVKEDEPWNDVTTRSG